MIELRYLVSFITVAETKNFRRAAEQLYITQPALTQQIAKLEQATGVKLLERDRRQVALTDAGELFLVEARKAVEQVEYALRVAQQADRGEIGQLSVAYVGSVLYSFLPKAIQLFGERYPQVELKLQELSSSEQVDRLVKHNIDIGILYGPVNEERLALQPVLRTPLWIALPETHRLAGQASVSLDQLKHEPFILVARDQEPALHDRYIGIFRQAGYAPNVIQEASQVQTILGFVALGIGIFPAAGHMRNIHREGIVYVPVSKPAPVIEVSIARRREDKSPMVQNYLEVVREVAR
jgi:DNA-binding transcriptional LysR family regulator